MFGTCFLNFFVWIFLSFFFKSCVSSLPAVLIPHIILHLLLSIQSGSSLYLIPLCFLLSFGVERTVPPNTPPKKRTTTTLFYITFFFRTVNHISYFVISNVTCVPCSTNWFPGWNSQVVLEFASFLWSDCLVYRFSSPSLTEIALRNDLMSLEWMSNISSHLRSMKVHPKIF